MGTGLAACRLCRDRRGRPRRLGRLADLAGLAVLAAIAGLASSAALHPFSSGSLKSVLRTLGSFYAVSISPPPGGQN